MPGYSQIMRRLLSPAVIGLGAYKFHTYQEQQKYKNLLGLATRIKEANGSVKESIPKTNALTMALFVNICINHPAETRAIIKSMQNIRAPEGYDQFEPLDSNTPKNIATKLQSGAELNFSEFMLYCRMLPAYRSAGSGSQQIVNGELFPAIPVPLYHTLYFENFILSELEEQYPGLDVRQIINDVKEKESAFHQVLGPNYEFMLTA